MAQTKTIVETFPGDRMDWRVIKWDRYFNAYQVQYQYSKKNNTWLNHVKPGNNAFFDTLAGARAAAKRGQKRNN